METIDQLIAALQAAKSDQGLGGDTPVFLTGYNDYGVVKLSSFRVIKVCRNPSCNADGEVSRMWEEDARGESAVFLQRDHEE
ncbi:hypothetical protein D3C85_1127820 [compost metagenome]